MNIITDNKRLFDFRHDVHKLYLWNDLLLFNIFCFSGRQSEWPHVPNSGADYEGIWPGNMYRLPLVQRRPSCGALSLTIPNVGASLADWSQIPSKHEDFIQCFFNIGPSPTALVQHWKNIGWSPRVCWVTICCIHTRRHSLWTTACIYWHIWAIMFRMRYIVCGDLPVLS